MIYEGKVLDIVCVGDTEQAGILEDASMFC